MNEREAFRRYRREEAMMRKWKDFVKRTMRELDFIEDSMHSDIARELATTRAGLKCLHTYRGRSEFGWMQACGTDGKWKRIARTVGWPRFSRIIWLARRMETW